MQGKRASHAVMSSTDAPAHQDGRRRKTLSRAGEGRKVYRSSEPPFDNGRCCSPPWARAERFGGFSAPVEDVERPPDWLAVGWPRTRVPLGTSTAVPGAGTLLRRLSGRSRDGWVVVPTGPRHVVEQIEILSGRLTVSGRTR